MASPSASAVFDAINADIILTSSDEVRFRVHKSILANASSVFEAMFDLPQQMTTSGEDELPTIPLAEPGLVLEQVLRFCYPSLNGNVSDLHTLRLLFQVADKYDMRGVTSQLAYILRYQFIDKEPHRAYAIACIYALWPEAVLAGKQTLAHIVPGPSLPEFDVLPASMYHKLVVYRQKCIDVIDPILDDWTYKVGMRDISWAGYGCKHCAKPNTTSPAYWFMDHLARTKAAFLAWPRGSSVSATKIAQDTVSKHLGTSTGVQCACRLNAPTRLVEFNERLAVVLDQKIAEVCDKFVYVASF
ncbi:hypothetical protein BC629DRAFT_794768 [Irpex lacteus]|nr:hypothetical protein BC629DRAFT_794768 [Irpex lacteus]